MNLLAGKTVAFSIGSVGSFDFLLQFCDGVGSRSIDCYTVLL